MGLNTNIIDLNIMGNNTNEYELFSLALQWLKEYDLEKYSFYILNAYKYKGYELT